jgi:uncharacterized RDD family membrane protein YckC
VIGAAQARAAARAGHDRTAQLAPPDYEGLATRAIAFAIDGATINLSAIAVATVVGLGLSVLEVPDAVSKAVIVLGGVAYVVWTVAYFVVFWSTTGQTPGSRLLQVRVCRSDDGAVLRPGQAVVRLIALTLAALPLLTGFLPILVDDRRRGLHDMIAGTVVVTAPVTDTPLR